MTRSTFSVRSTNLVQDKSSRKKLSLTKKLPRPKSFSSNTWPREIWVLGLGWTRGCRAVPVLMSLTVGSVPQRGSELFSLIWGWIQILWEHTYMCSARKCSFRVDS